MSETDRYRVTAGELRQIVERVERIQSEKRDLSDQEKEVFAEARARGYDTKVLKKLIALRKRDASEVSEEEAILELYKDALGMGGTPLGDWSAGGAFDDTSITITTDGQSVETSGKELRRAAAAMTAA